MWPLTGMLNAHLRIALAIVTECSHCLVVKLAFHVSWKQTGVAMRRSCKETRFMETQISSYCTIFSLSWNNRRKSGMFNFSRWSQDKGIAWRADQWISIFASNSFIISNSWVVTVIVVYYNCLLLNERDNFFVQNFLFPSAPAERAVNKKRWMMTLKFLLNNLI